LQPVEDSVGLLANVAVDHKAANVAGLALVASLLAVAGCIVVGRLMLPTGGLNTAHGYALVSVSDSPTLRAAALASVRYLVLHCPTQPRRRHRVRDTPVSIGAVLRPALPAALRAFL
jgi:ABC-2 type transport system permease protein